MANAEDAGHPAAAATNAQESSWSRYKAVLSNPRLLIAGLSIGFQNAARYGLIL